MASGSPIDLHPNSLSYPDARMESYRADSGRCADLTCAALRNSLAIVLTPCLRLCKLLGESGPGPA